jgi:hypothetical protein
MPNCDFLPLHPSIDSLPNDKIQNAAIFHVRQPLVFSTHESHGYLAISFAYILKKKHIQQVITLLMLCRPTTMDEGNPAP